MSPEHQRLAALLREAATTRGGIRALAVDLDLDRRGIRDLINGDRFITMRQALRIEEVLGVSARDLLIEAAIAKIDEELAKARSGK
jgi:plasmid maintenance system antidote protein VapI